MAATCVIHIVDDDAAIRESLSGLLAQNGYRVHEHPSADSFLASMAATGSSDVPTLVISDVRMPGRSGVGLLQELRARTGAGGRAVSVILLTGHASVPLAVEAMRGGALHFLEKPVDPDVLLATVEAAFEDTPLPSSRPEGAEARLRALTPREREVLAAFIARGSNKAVANALNMSPRTVEVHRTRIFRKSGASSVTELVRIGLEAGLLVDSPQN